jgi:hypothetical protein
MKDGDFVEAPVDILKRFTPELVEPYILKLLVILEHFHDDIPVQGVAMAEQYNLRRKIELLDNPYTASDRIRANHGFYIAPIIVLKIREFGIIVGTGCESLNEIHCSSDLVRFVAEPD